MLSRLRSTNALTVYVPPAIYSAGSTIAGEVELDFRHLQEEKIDEVQVRLRGASKTCVRLSSLSRVIANELRTA